MGYYVKIKIKNLVIPAENVETAHVALKELWTDKPTGWLLRRREASFLGVEKWRGYDWVFYREGGYSTLVEELDSWHYNATLNTNGSVVLKNFLGEKRKG